MTDLAKSALDKGYRFECPHCNTEWPYEVVKHVACFTREEQIEVESKLEEAYMEKELGIQKCPKCYNYCDRNDPENCRVICPVCTKNNGSSFEFCWKCLHKWSGPHDSTSKCGNQHCSSSDTRNYHLRNCEKKTMGYNDVICPSVRACPHCGVLIDHEDGCKRMRCKNCQKEFCFVCLEVRIEDDVLLCGNEVRACSVAPIQQF